MDVVFKTFRLIFAEHYIMLLVLAVSWIFIYLALKFADYFARKLLLRLPFYFGIRFKRKRIGVTSHRDNIVAGRPLNDEDKLKLASKVGKLYCYVDESFTGISGGEHWVTKVLPKQSIRNELEAIKYKDWALLESDFALCEALSADRKASERGLVNFCGNPEPTFAEKCGLLIYSLRFGPENSREAAKSFIKYRVTDKEHLKALANLAPEMNFVELMQSSVR